jgi:hypothetical protein
MRCLKTAYELSVEKPERNKQLRSGGVSGRIMLKWVIRKEGVSVWTRFS